MHAKLRAAAVLILLAGGVHASPAMAKTPAAAPVNGGFEADGAAVGSPSG